MTVSNVQVAALRAFLGLRADDTERLTQQLIEADLLEGYGELISGAFTVAVRRRFLPTWTMSDLIRFVAVVRARLLGDEIDIDPRTAEIAMRRALGDGIAARLDEEATARAQIFLLGELIIDEDLDDTGLDEFLATARELADQLAD
jgi:hypothetical protein